MTSLKKCWYLLSVCCWIAVIKAETNLALGKYANQSSDLDTYTAEIAVNNRTDDFTHTTYGKIDPWWTVDLKDTYHVTRIKLFNRPKPSGATCDYCDRLQQIYILTSSDKSPGPPSTGGNWEVRSYRDKPYGEVGTILLESNVPVRHIAVYSLHRAALSLAEVQVFALNNNLAYDKTAVQHTPYASSAHSANLAVDGKFYARDAGDNEVTHTRDEADQYWRVDLGEVYDVKWIELYNRNNNAERLSEITIWGTNKSLTTPLRFASTWERLHSQKEPYGAVGVLILDRVHRFRHIAVSKNGIISLKEVQVFSRKRTNYAVGKRGRQKSSLKDFSYASDAVDGKLDTRSLTGESTGQWWKVDLEKRIIFQYARIFARDDDCSGTPCYRRLKKMSYLTNYDPHDPSKPDEPPTKLGSTWKKCFYSEEQQGVEFTVVCEKNLSPYIQQFAILSGHNKGIALREVEIYGYDHVPTFTRQRRADVTRTNGKQLEVKFDKWNIDDMPGIYNSFPNANSNQFKYVISLAGERSKTIPFSTTGPVQFNWSDLNPYITYRFLVSCQIANKSWLGPFTSILAPAKNCSAPDPPSDISLTYVVFEEKRKKRLKYTAEWKAPSNINCLWLKVYRYKLNDGPVETTTNPVVRFEAEPGGINITITVWVINDAGLQSREKIKSISTPDLKSEAPRNIKLTSTSPYSVLLSWEDPTNTYGKVLTYQYKCTNKGWINHTDSPVTVDAYPPYSPVSCQVRVINRAGAGYIGDSPKVRTLCADPNIRPISKPKDDYVFGTNCTSYRRVTLTIDKAQDIEHNCESLTAIGFSRMVNLQQPSFNRSNIFPNLAALTTYTFEIKATNNAGNTSTRTLDFKTDELEPDAPGMVLSVEVDSCINLTLTKPKQSRGNITYYSISCAYLERKDIIPLKNLSSADNQEEKTSICNLFSASTVECKAAGGNKIGSCRYSESEKGITRVIIINETSPRVEKESNAVTIIFKPVILKDGIVPSSYLVVVGSSGIAKRATSTSPCKAGMESIKKQSLINSSSSSCYITAEMLAHRSNSQGGYRLEIGDGKTYGKYNNRLLKGSTQYSVRLFAVYKARGSKESWAKVVGNESIFSSPPSQAPATESNSPPATESNSLPPAQGPLIGGIVGAILALLIAAIIVGYLIRRKRSQNRQKREEQTDMTNIDNLPLPRTDRVASSIQPSTYKKKLQTVPIQPKSTAASKKCSTPPPDDDDDDDDNMYVNASGVVVPVDGLDVYIAENYDLINEHYQKLKTIPDPDMSIALLAENKGKNRYKGLYPANKHRVPLKKAAGSGYINATYIQGYHRDNHYIAAQGATESTANDFWAMIWQENPSAIIMVTQTVESGKKKCYQYWPENQGDVMNFGDTSVTLLSSELWADYAIRTLLVKRGEETRTIKHFNYVTWPDHGVPDDMGPFIIFYQKIKSATSRLTSATLLVHCSAGVGRTGTFIAMDLSLEQAKVENVINVFSCVKNMRKRRPAMVQTVEQYQFLHQALYESLATSGYVSSPDLIGIKMERFLRSPGSPADSISQEYLHIEKKVKLTTFDFSLGKEPENRDKNRFSEILPARKYSPYLLGESGIYINAVFANTYRQKNQWLATQLPLSNTVIDFWQLVKDKGIKVVVQLDPSQVPFYPRGDNDQMVAGPFTITRIKTENTDYVTTINLEVQTKGRLLEVVVVMVKGWEADIPSSDTIISLQDAMERSQQQTGDNKICVTCNNGSTRCGLFICCYNAIEKLKAEQEADVFNAVLMAKHRRPQFIPSKEYYLFIYQVLKDYTDAFSEYANFK